ncbi:unnamed protein product [Calypogeia fissa]
MLYSIWYVKGHGGWVGLIMCTIAAFISSDVVVYFLSNSGSEGNQETEYGEKQSVILMLFLGSPGMTTLTRMFSNGNIGNWQCSFIVTKIKETRKLKKLLNASKMLMRDLTTLELFECQDYHQAKDGDSWVEQSGQSFFFGMFQKVICRLEQLGGYC